MSEKITVEVVFGGPSFTNDFPPRQKVAQVVRATLRDAGREGEDPAAWELKTVDGRVLDQTKTLLEEGLTDGVTLHLVAPAGEGGA